MQQPQEPKKPVDRKKNINFKDPRERVYLVVISVLVIAVAILTVQLYNNQTSIENITVVNNDLLTDKQKLTNELNEMLEQYNDLETDNKELQGEMLEQKQKIQDLLEDVKNNKANIQTIAKYKKEVGTLRVIMKGYVGTIDSLNTLNLELMSENKNINTKLSESRKTAESLKNEKENLAGIVKNASRLQIIEPEIQGLRERNNGNFARSSRANRIDKIESCLFVLENKTTTAEKKELYVRLIAPDSSLVETTETKTFTADGQSFSSSASKQFDYNNKEMDVCVYITPKKELLEGIYTIMYYESGGFIGSKTFELR